jgi:LuxR family maltose regulon positive regulatory protein
MKARIRISQGRLAEAAAWARERDLSATGDLGYLREYDHLTLVRLLLARHRAHHDAGTTIAPATRLLGRLLEDAERTARAGSVLEIRMLQALARQAEGHRSLALDALERALTEAPEPTGYARLFLDEGAPMVALLREAEKRSTLVDHARRLLTAARPGDGPVPKAPAEQLSERELQVLRLLDTTLSGPQIARQLFVSLNTLRTHTKHIVTKLDVNSRPDAVRRARERGLL